MSERSRVASVADVPPGEALVVDFANEPVAIFNVDGVFYAVSDTCPHAGGSLAEGWVEELRVTCPWHGWHFPLKQMPGAPDDGICRYTVTVEDGEIFLQVPDES